MRGSRIADEAHAPCRDIVQPADVVVHDAGGVDRQTVDGEIAPLGVANPVAAERDLGLAAEGLGVLAQGGDLERLSIDHQRHGAVVDAGRHALDAGRLGAADHLGRQGGGRDIDIGDRNLQQRIADRAADHARFLAIAVEQFEHAGGRTGSEPGRDQCSLPKFAGMCGTSYANFGTALASGLIAVPLIDLKFLRRSCGTRCRNFKSAALPSTRPRHFSAPGINLPFSICAGM